MAAIGHGEAYIIPATETTRGHGTTASQAALYADRLAELLAGAPSAAEEPSNCSS